MRIFLFSWIFIFSLNTFSNEMVLVKTISNSQKTFITTNGKDSGNEEGLEGVFTTANVSFVARAVRTTREYTYWEVVNPRVLVPLKRGEIVNFSRTTEDVWELTSKNVIEELKFKRLNKRVKAKSIILRTSLMSGLEESTSYSLTQETKRVGNQFEFIMEYPIGNYFAWGVGARYDTEAISVSGVTYNSTKYIAIGELTAYFEKLKEIKDSSFYLGLVFGFGTNTTSLGDYTQSGTVKVMPGIRFGLNIPLTNSLDLMTELGLESVSIIDKIPDDAATIQTTNQVNAKGTIGLRILI